jgi:hypothetical protein
LTNVQRRTVDVGGAALGLDVGDLGEAVFAAEGAAFDEARWQPTMSTPLAPSLDGAVDDAQVIDAGELDGVAVPVGPTSATRRFSRVTWWERGVEVAGVVDVDSVAAGAADGEVADGNVGAAR